MIQCLECGAWLDRIAGMHLKYCCGKTTAEYEKDHPGAPTEDEEVTTTRAENTSLANQGREFSEEHKEALRKAREGLTLSDEHRENIGKSMEGR